ncbi:MAG: EamA family transporter [Raineya sp.]|nr:EamA family transporter [Raineya sp.]MDW8295475.1 EamA family transporter [Raineya sp.]
MNFLLFSLTFLQVLTNIVGSALVKISLYNKKLSNLSDFIKIIVDFYFLTGLLLIVVGFVFTAYILHKINLSVYQPISSGLSFIVTILISYFFLKEAISWNIIVGIFLIFTGIFFISFFKSN